MSRLPSFFLVGAPRCGTTTLNEVLDAHPEIFMSANKEPWFYAISDRSEPFTGPGDGQGIRSRSDYEALFEASGSAVAVGEASTLYLSSEHAAERIALDVPDARIVVTLRDPVQRAFSNFSQHRWQARETLGFDEALAAGPGRVASGWAPFWDYEALSRYGAQLENWFRVFDREQVHAILFDDLVTRRNEVLSDLYGHVGVDPSFRPPDPGAVNASGQPKSARLHAFLRGSSGPKRLLKAMVPSKARAAMREGVDRRNVSKAELPADQRPALEARLRTDLEHAGDLLGADLVKRWFG